MPRVSPSDKEILKRIGRWERDARAIVAGRKPIDSIRRSSLDLAGRLMDRIAGFDERPLSALGWPGDADFPGRSKLLHAIWRARTAVVKARLAILGRSDDNEHVPPAAPPAGTTGPTAQPQHTWFPCSKTDLLRALNKRRTNTRHLDQLVTAGRLELRPAAHPVGYHRYEARFRDPAEHTRVIDLILIERDR
jgi:hypothetical protein